VTDTGIRKVKILKHLKIHNVLCVAVTTLLGLIPSVVLSENNIVSVVGENLMFDQTEVTIGAFENFVRATGTVTQAERDGAGLVYAGGWEQKAGWTWLTPYGQAAHPDEPAVHVTFDEAVQYCKWAGKRLPTEEEWIIAAYNEQRLDPSKLFVQELPLLGLTGFTIWVPMCGNGLMHPMNEVRERVVALGGMVHHKCRQTTKLQSHVIWLASVLDSGVSGRLSDSF
jgi:hypothetical protein